MYIFMGLLARMVNAMGSRPLRRLEGWGRDSVVSEPMIAAWALMDHVEAVIEAKLLSAQQRSKFGDWKIQKKLSEC